MALEQVPDEARQSLGAALESYVDAVVQRWRIDGTGFLKFERHSVLTFRTTGNVDAARTPVAGRLVRGGAGVEVKLSEVNGPATLYEALTDIPQAFGIRELTPPEARIVEMLDDVADAIKASPPLRRQLVRTIWGAYAATISDASEEGPLADSRMAAFSLRSAFARYATTEMQLDLASMDGGITAAHVTEFLKHVRADVEATEHWFTVDALLNAPIADLATDALIFEGQWHDRVCFLGIGYPSDERCQRVLKAAGHTHIPWKSGIGHVNCSLRFTYALPTDREPEETEADHYRAAESVKQAVDVSYCQMLWIGGVS